jgi:hypothetical protein
MNIRIPYRLLACLALTLVCAVAFLAPAVAGAQVHQGSPTADEYDPALVPPPQSSNGSGGGGSGDSATVAGLPFTGAEVGVLAIAAVVLVGGGMALRTYIRAERPERS